MKESKGRCVQSRESCSNKMRTYAAYYDHSERIESSSGGIFSLLSKQFDVIYGVEMDAENQNAVFARKTDDISTLRGSKYLQAKVGNTFKQVKKDLQDNKKVLFGGTSCQVNGLLAFLQKDYPNLFTIDVICHGVPSPKYWRKFSEGIKVENVNFRAKNGGWDNYTYGMMLNDIYIPYDKNRYMSLYVKNYMLRPCCYECVCKRAKRSDITLGDFWGIEKLDCSMTDNKGTSVVIVRTDKGQTLFDGAKEDMVWKEVSYEDGVKQNPSEYSSSSMPLNRLSFFEDMEKFSFNALYEKYTSTASLWRRGIWKARQLLLKIVRKERVK